MDAEKPRVEPLLIGVDDLATMLSISRAALYSALSTGKVGPMRIKAFGRRTLFSLEEVKSWIRSGCVNRDQWLLLREHTA